MAFTSLNGVGPNVLTSCFLCYSGCIFVLCLLLTCLLDVSWSRRVFRWSNKI